MSVTQIPSSDIKVGMYVCKLDRPWLETPFLFQGFEVRTEEEIEDLIRFTNFVYINESDAKVELEKKNVSPGDGGIAADNLFHRKVYQDTVTVDEEIRNIRSSHETLSKVLSNFHALAQSGSISQYKVLEQQIEHMVKSVINNADAYLWLTRMKRFDSFLYRDALTSGVLAASMGRTLGLSKEDIVTLSTGCVLMDIGKLMLPRDILNKASRLDRDEWEAMKSHVELGVKLLQDKPVYSMEVLDIIRTHHERLDGCGYPAGLHGEQISLFGQIAGIIDQYVSVTNDRPFTKAISASMAEDMLYKQRGKLFDEVLVEYFIETLGTYPTGSLVELSTGEVGIVRSQAPGLRLKPNIILVLNQHKIPYGSFVFVSLVDYVRGNESVSVTRTVASGEYGLNVEELAIDY